MNQLQLLNQQLTPLGRVLRDRIMLSIENHIKYIVHPVFVEASHVFGDLSFSLFMSMGTVAFSNFTTRVANWIYTRVSFNTREYLLYFASGPGPLTVNSNIATAIGCAVVAYMKSHRVPYLDWVNRDINGSVNLYANLILARVELVDGAVAEQMVDSYIRERIYVSLPLKVRIAEYALLYDLDPAVVFAEAMKNDPNKQIAMNYWEPTINIPRDNVIYIL